MFNGSVEQKKPPVAKPIPVIGEAAADPSGGFDTSDADYYVSPVISIRHPDACAFKVRNDSMMPMYHQGDVVICSRREPIGMDDHVVALLDSGDIVLKVWRQVGGQVYLHSLNEAYQPLQLDREVVVDRMKVVGLIWRQAVVEIPAEKDGDDYDAEIDETERRLRKNGHDMIAEFDRDEDEEAIKRMYEEMERQANDPAFDPDKMSVRHFQPIPKKKADALPKPPAKKKKAK